MTNSNPHPSTVETSPPRLSVTLTNYNYARFLPQALDSILAQTYREFELIVIDNASTDESLAIIRAYAERDSRMRVISHDANVGALASLRESCDLCRGVYRVHVDADDWIIAADAFERQIAILDANAEMTFVYSCLTMFDGEGTKTYVSHAFDGDVVVPGDVAVEAVLGFTLNHTGTMMRLDAYRRTDGYPDGLPHVDDMLLAVRLCELGSVGYIDDELYSFRQHGANVHLAPQLKVLREEFLYVVEAAFDGPLGPELSAKTRRRILKKTLVHLPTQYIFKGEPVAGWRLWLQSARVRPMETIFQKRTISLVARTVFGGRLYSALDERLHRRAVG
jgi:glycosyltransferase involved in cell wall biosynthesis